MLFRTLRDDLGLTLRHARRAKAFYPRPADFVALAVVIVFAILEGYFGWIGMAVVE